MVFKRKASFFLDLSGEDAGSSAAQPATIAVREATPEPPKPEATQSQAITKPDVSAKPQAASDDKPVLTTADAIAAELRAAQEALPPPSTATFAPDCLNPANAVPQKRRRAGANLAGFKAMGASLLRS